MSKSAIITGVTGQDGSYLAEFLLEKGYNVHGLRRRSSQFNTSRIDHLINGHHKLKLHYSDLTDPLSLLRIIQEVRPDEIYNLAAMSHVAVSFETPLYTANVDAMGTIALMEAVRLSGLEEACSIYHASTSELYGKVQQVPQSERTPFYPRSPYAVAKLYAFWIVKNYREAYNMKASNGILFNHESPRRGETFVTRKITMALARIAAGTQTEIVLGNLNSKRDWGHAKDYVRAMWLINQADAASDWVVASGECYSIREFLSRAFAVIGVEIGFEGEGINEIGRVLSNNGEFSSIRVGDKVVKVDAEYFRPSEVDLLLGDPSKIKRTLDWSPEYSFDDLVTEMVLNDIRLNCENIDAV